MDNIIVIRAKSYVESMFLFSSGQWLERLSNIISKYQSHESITPGLASDTFGSIHLSYSPFVIV